VSLPTPNLDDRAFQDFVDEGKRLLQRRAPEWTDNNVADPGVTLIETFAYMVDQLVFRLNQVPDLHYIKFLELLGETLRPPAAAYTTLEFMLTVPQETDVQILEGAEVSTTRRGTPTPITFTTDDDLTLVSVTVNGLLSQPNGGAFSIINPSLGVGAELAAFSQVPTPGDAIYFGLSKPAAHCIVQFAVDSRIDGIGVDPLRPPRIFEAWDGQAWYPVELISDTTGGLNRQGTIQIYIDRHQTSNLGSIDAAWLRCRVVAVEGDQPPYVASPTIHSVSVVTIGGRVSASHCQHFSNETLGRTSGTPGESLQLSHFPLVSEQDALTIEVSSPEGWVTWNRVDTFADQLPDARVFSLDSTTGTLRFGPLIRMNDGSARTFGATPEAGATVRIPLYRAGGGVLGNLETGALRLLRTSIPFVARVQNIVPAIGGVDAESIDDLKARAALLIRSRDRAVSKGDFELLVHRAAPSLARTKCLSGEEIGSPGTVLVLVIPDIPDGRVPFEVFRPSQEVLDSVQTFIDERRLVGTTVRIEPPRYLGVSVAARIALSPGVDSTLVLQEADTAVANFVHPLRGGYDGTGWTFGRDISVGDIYGVLQKVEGVDYVDVARLIPVDAVSGERAEPTDRIALATHDLLFSVLSDFEVLQR
jgi:predicted phage baseplate assembly protein